MQKLNFQNYIVRVLEEHCPNRRFEIFFELKPLLDWIKEEEKKQKELSHKLFELLEDNKEARTLLQNLNYHRAQFFSNLKKAFS